MDSFLCAESVDLIKAWLCMQSTCRKNSRADGNEYLWFRSAHVSTLKMQCDQKKRSLGGVRFNGLMEA